MALDLDAVCFAANEPARLIAFWSALLGWEQSADDTLDDSDGTGFRIRFVPTAMPRTEKLRGHLDLTSTSLDDQDRLVARALELGGRHCDVGQLPEEPHVVLADPEGNELCVIEPSNAFLSDCGLVGALACDGSREVGDFWSTALEWPLVWDEGDETAIRSPHGGPKITWGGVPPGVAIGHDRLRLDLVPLPGSDQTTEVVRLIGLGASAVSDGTDDGSVVLLDPDGCAFHVRAPRQPSGLRP